MFRPSTTVIYSIFGQIDEVAANIMIEKHGCTRIPLEEIPDSALCNELGQKAKFAIIVPRTHINMFENLIRTLRA